MTDTEFHKWQSVAKLAAAEDVTPRQIYWAIDHGLPHSRIGHRIRVRRSDWHAFHEAHMVNAKPAAGRKSA